MLPTVEQHVRVGVADRARRGQGRRVVAVGKEAPLAAEHLVGALTDADTEREDAGAEGGRRIRFDDEVQVIVLKREGEHPKVSAGRVERDS